MNKKLNKKGFTIVELVIVIAVIAILAAVMIPTFSSIINKANANKALTEVKNAYTEALAYDLDPANDDEADKVYDKDVYIKHTNGTIIHISANGSAEIVDKAPEGTTVQEFSYLALPTEAPTTAPTEAP